MHLRERVVQIDEGKIRVPAQSQVQGQSRRNLPVVLNEERILSCARAIAVFGDLFNRSWSAKQKISRRISGKSGAKANERISAEKLLQVENRTAQISTDAEEMPAALQAQNVGKLQALAKVIQREA